MIRTRIEPNPKTVGVSIIQATASDDIQQNVASALHAIEQAVDQGGQVICLQELFNSKYFCQSEEHDCFNLAEPIPGPTTERLQQAARQHQVVIVAGLFERRAPGVFHNSAIVIDADGSLAGKYRKMHIPDDPFYYEKFYFTPGDLGFRAFNTRFGKIGVCVCWDQWFPEAARLTALNGAQLLVYPTAIGWLAQDKPEYGESQVTAWQTMMRSHAIANGVFVAAPNRVGIEDNIEFWGNSFISDPYGNLLAQGPRDTPAVITQQCDWGLIEVARTHWPFLRDRRIDAYGPLTRRFIDDPQPTGLT